MLIPGASAFVSSDFSSDFSSCFSVIIFSSFLTCSDTEITTLPLKKIISATAIRYLEAFNIKEKICCLGCLRTGAAMHHAYEIRRFSFKSFTDILMLTAFGEDYSQVSADFYFYP